MPRRTRGFPPADVVTCTHFCLRTQNTSGLSWADLVLEAEERSLDHVLQRDAGVGCVDRPVEQLVAGGNGEEDSASPVVVSAEPLHGLREHEGEAGREERLAPDRRESAAAVASDRPRPHGVAVEERPKVRAPERDKPRDGASPVSSSRDGVATASPRSTASTSRSPGATTRA